MPFLNTPTIYLFAWQTTCNALNQFTQNVLNKRLHFPYTSLYIPSASQLSQPDSCQEKQSSISWNECGHYDGNIGLQTFVLFFLLSKKDSLMQSQRSIYIVFKKNWPTKIAWRKEVFIILNHSPYHFLVCLLKRKLQVKMDQAIQDNGSCIIICILMI